MAFDLTLLDQFRKTPLPAGYPADIRTLYSPKDDVHAGLMMLLKSAKSRVHIAMYGFDDEELAQVVLERMQAPSVSVSLTFDSSQASGVHERKLLAGVNYPATSIAVGRSERGALMHMKCIVVDDIRISGSTNWSSGGESLQDNELTIISNALIANEAAGRIAEIHAWMLARAA